MNKKVVFSVLLLVLSLPVSSFSSSSRAVQMRRGSASTPLLLSSELEIGQPVGREFPLIVLPDLSVPVSGLDNDLVSGALSSSVTQQRNSSRGRLASCLTGLTKCFKTTRKIALSDGCKVVYDFAVSIGLYVGAVALFPRTVVVAFAQDQIARVWNKHTKPIPFPVKFASACLVLFVAVPTDILLYALDIEANLSTIPVLYIYYASESAVNAKPATTLVLGTQCGKKMQSKIRYWKYKCYGYEHKDKNWEILEQLNQQKVLIIGLQNYIDSLHVGMEKMQKEIQELRENPRITEIIECSADAVNNGSEAPVISEVLNNSTFARSEDRAASSNEVSRDVALEMRDLIEASVAKDATTA